VLLISRARKERLDNLAAMAVYMGARLFALFEEPHMGKFVNVLSDRLYTLPNRCAISRDLLNTAYIQVRAKVLQLLDQQETL
jgi:hypothetical protein